MGRGAAPAAAHRLLTMLIAIASLVFLAVCFTAISLLLGQASLLAARGAVLPYRQSRATEAALPLELARSLGARLLLPWWARLTDLAGRLLPGDVLRRTQRRLEQAGLSPGSVRGYLVLQGLLALGGLVTAMLLHRAFPLPPRLSTALFVAGPIVALMIPNWYLDRLAGRRRQALQAALPDAIDILVVSVQAGLGLDGAIQELVGRDEGPLADELARAQAEIRAGRSRDAAWHDMAERSGVSELSTFVSAVCQGERLGASIAHILHSHAEAMRIRRSLYARELAAKIPVKMLFPMIFFIFPCLFVVMLGPGIVMMVHNFKGVMF